MHRPAIKSSAWYPTGGCVLGDRREQSKVKRLVPDFICTTPFSRGAEEIIAWHMADPARQRVDLAFNAFCDRILQAYAKAWPG